MIKYRPHRETLTASLKDEMIFNSLKELMQYVYEDWRRVVAFMGGRPFARDEIMIRNILGDPRVGWKGAFPVCVTRMSNDILKRPLCIGYFREQEKGPEE